MKLDMKRPYGLIYGHSFAQYEQDGKLFDSTGLLLVESEHAPEPKPTSEETKFSEAQARAFLTGILAGGPILRSAVYRECEANNQNWDDVRTVFAQIGYEQKIRNGIFWKLKTE